MKAQLTTSEAIQTFIFGGKSTFTLRSLKTDAHISFNVKKAKDGGCYFVYARKGGDDGQGGFNYAGWVRPDMTEVRVSKKSHASLDGARLALDWTLGKLAAGEKPDMLEVWHEGRCCRCNRKLTDPVSIERGIGPECYSKVTGSKVIK